MKNEERKIKNETWSKGNTVRKMSDNRRAFLLFAFCIVHFSLFISCENPFVNKTQPSASVPADIPDGMGSFTLRVASSAAKGKVIMPSGIDKSYFSSYLLEFYVYTSETTPDTSGEADYSFPIVLDADDVSQPVILAPGTYYLRVTAFVEANKPAAKAVLDPVEITSGDNTIGEAQLKAIDDSGTGNFSWDIEYPGDVTEAYMEITPASGGIVKTYYFEHDTEEKVENPGSLDDELDSGYYYVVFTLKKDSGAITWRETLHVYQNMTSRFEYEFTDLHFSTNIYTVTYVYNDGSTVDYVKSYLHGSDKYGLASTPTRTGYVIDGWYIDNTTFANEYGNFSTPLTADLTLYAKWQFDMVLIPPTTSPLTLGSLTGDDDEAATGTVTLSSFYMGRYLVTQEQYLEVTGHNPSYFPKPFTTAAGENIIKLPVESVSWYDAIEFCNKLSIAEGFTPVYDISGRTPSTGYPITDATVTANWTNNGYRLPTEAEWEYACRAGTSTAFNTGAAITDNTGWYADNTGTSTHAVGLKTANAWGLHDMHGNVWEWCWDWYGPYPAGAENDPKGAADGVNRVSRGGGWLYEEEYLRSAYRGVSTPDDSHEVLGFRVVRGTKNEQ